jgi:hypothetical protein
MCLFAAMLETHEPRIGIKPGFCKASPSGLREEKNLLVSTTPYSPRPLFSSSQSGLSGN